MLAEFVRSFIHSFIPWINTDAKRETQKSGAGRNFLSPWELK